MQTRLADTETPEGLAADRGNSHNREPAIDALPEDLRTAIVLRELEGLSYEEIAAGDGMPRRHGAITNFSRARGHRQSACREVLKAAWAAPRSWDESSRNDGSQLSALFDGELPRDAGGNGDPAGAEGSAQLRASWGRVCADRRRDPRRAAGRCGCGLIATCAARVRRAEPAVDASYSSRGAVGIAAGRSRSQARAALDCGAWRGWSWSIAAACAVSPGAGGVRPGRALVARAAGRRRSRDRRAGGRCAAPRESGVASGFAPRTRQASRGARATPRRWTIPQRRALGAPLVNYVVAHSEVAARRCASSPLSAVMSGGQDLTQDTVEMTDGPRSGRIADAR